MKYRKIRRIFTYIITILVLVVTIFVWLFYTNSFFANIFITPYPEMDFTYDVEYGFSEEEKQQIIDSDLSIHILQLGNIYNGDSTYIKVGDIDILVDAGSRPSSADAIESYLNNYIDDNIIEYLIVTHGHEDHLSALNNAINYKGLFERYQINTIIDFPKTDLYTLPLELYYKYRDKEIENGAKHYTALECYNNENGAQRVLVLSENVEIEFLYNRYFEIDTKKENNYSVCFLLKHKTNNGVKNFLFTGDLEKKGEAALIKDNDLPEVEFYKAGHHGSYTSSNMKFLDVIKPKIIGVNCCIGSTQYTDNVEKTFPTVKFFNRVSKYTDKIYAPVFVDYLNQEVTLFNGTIVVCSTLSETNVLCSNVDTSLIDTTWYKEEREKYLIK